MTTEPTTPSPEDDDSPMGKGYNPSPEADLSELRSQVSTFADKLQRASSESNRQTIQGEMFNWFDKIVDAAKEVERRDGFGSLGVKPLQDGLREVYGSNENNGNKQ